MEDASPEDYIQLGSQCFRRACTCSSSRSGQGAVGQEGYSLTCAQAQFEVCQSCKVQPPLLDQPRPRRSWGWPLFRKSLAGIQSQSADNMTTLVSEQEHCLHRNDGRGQIDRIGRTQSYSSFVSSSWPLVDYRSMLDLPSWEAVSFPWSSALHVLRTTQKRRETQMNPHFLPSLACLEASTHDSCVPER